MNKTIKLLILSDIFLLTGFGLVDPILAIFIKENLVGGTIFAAGFASTLFLVTKSIIQLPFSRYIDAHDAKIKWLLAGTFLIALVPFVYIFAENIYYIWGAQVLRGIAAGLAYPSWLSLFSTHLDRKHEGFEWSLYSTSVCLGTASAAGIGATIAMYLGFQLTFSLVGVMALIGAVILIGLEKRNRNKTKYSHYHKKRKLVPIKGN
jgi:MFS family permease